MLTLPGGIASRVFLVCLAVAMLASVGCSSSEQHAASSTVEAFQAPESEEAVPRAAVEDARAVVVDHAEMSSGERRCVTLRLGGDVDLVDEVLVGDAESAQSTVTELISDCGRALAIVPAFVSGMSDERDAGAVRTCLRELFLTLTADERAEVTGVVTGTAEDVGAAGTVVAGVSACRDDEAGS